MRTDTLRDEFDHTIRWRVFPLHPETPEDGQELSDLFAGRYDIEAMMDRCKQVAKELNLPFGNRTRTYNSRRAQELGKWAEQQGSGETFHRAVYTAYFVEGRNIALPTELANIAAEVGLDSERALQVIDERSFASAVEADWQMAAELGVTAVPTAIFQQRSLVGFQPYANYRRLLNATD